MSGRQKSQSEDRFGVYAFTDEEFRVYFKTEINFRKAMEKARWLESRGCPIRAHRVRLNIDGD